MTVGLMATSAVIDTNPYPVAKNIYQKTTCSSQSEGSKYRKVETPYIKPFSFKNNMINCTKESLYSSIKRNAVKKENKKSLFIFRRDLRLPDNTGLIAALKTSENVFPTFIYDPQQISSENKFLSENAVQFMVESLEDLKKQLYKKKGKLYEFYGTPSEVIEDLFKKNEIDALFLNKDYTPFSKKRDEELEKICKKNNIDFHSFHDELINPPNTVFTQKDAPYTIFTPFFKKSRKTNVTKPQRLYASSLSKGTIKSKFTKLPQIKFDNKNIAEKGGRTVSQKILKNINDFKNYNEERNFPAINGTTMLSAHNKFGTSSIREVYYAIKDNLPPTNDLIQELYWRDFFTYIADHVPYVFKGAFKEKYNKIKWKNNRTLFKKWRDGLTGFPIVDAGIRELNQTGFMHNRVRMIVGSFLVKDLHINWQWGEKYFATQLVDYDPSVNNGNWQWVASTGSDAQPYFKIFNPWTQQKKFDPECIYVKRWIPELKNIPIKEIHQWYKCHSKDSKYPAPIVEHAKQIKITKKMYQVV